MLCRACGMESRTADFCEWCRRPLAAQPTLPQNAPPAQKPVRVTLTGEVIADESPAPPAGGPGAYSDPNAAMPPPAMPYAANTPIGATLQANPSAITPLMVQQHYQESEESVGEKREKFLAIGLPVLIVSMLIVHFAPGAFLWVACADLFALSLIMGAVGAIPAYDDAVSDCAIMLILTFLFGPLLALGIYLIVGLFKQEWNPAILGLLALNLAVDFLLTRAVFSNMSMAAFSSFAVTSLFSMMIMRLFAGFICFAGWMLSSFFRPLDA